MLTARPAKTFDDLMALPPETRAELIEGEIIMSPTPTSRHQVVVGNLYEHLRAFLRKNPLGTVFLSPLDVILSRRAVVEPDVIFVSSDRSHIIRKWIEGAPDLAIEVLSPGTKVEDRIVKRRLYARYGVREYWIVDPEGCTVEVLSLSGKRYALHALFEAKETLRSPLLPSLKLSLSAIFEA